MDDHACLPLCSFAQACEGRSLQADTPELAYATSCSPVRIGHRSGLPWVRLIPSEGMLTTTGPLGTASHPYVFVVLVSEPSTASEARDRGKRVAVPCAYSGSGQASVRLPLGLGRDTFLHTEGRSFSIHITCRSADHSRLCAPTDWREARSFLALHEVRVNQLKSSSIILDSL
uniref:Uncharacterized protein n=1 Tax=Ananas comosus var. bracteatus TaxID=296719 RepID=A0A6V7Q5Q7_ANACO|nr:unnamed protein product [Ananas comosus var. bracteatus]